MSITDLIDYISGVNIIHRGAIESQPTIKYRGSSSNHFVFLIDGMHSFHSNIIYDNLNFPFDIDDLDYVEINTSPSSHKYGFSSSGVILNFVLKKYDTFAAKFNSEAGDYSHSKLYLDTNIPLGQSNHTFSLNSKNNDGFIYNSDIAMQKMLYRYSLKDEKSALNIMFGTFLDEHGVITKSEISKYPVEKYNNSFFNSRISHNFNKMSLISHTHWNESEYSYFLGNNINNYIVTDAGYDFKGERITKTQQSTFGFSFARRTISNLLNSEIQRDRFNIFYNDVVKKGSFIYSDGFSANYADDFGWKYSYGIQLKYLLTNDLKISYEYDDGYKLPSFFEQYSSFGEWRGNINVQSESVKTNEIGLSINNNILNLEISLFHRLTKNALDWEFSNLDNYWIAANIPQVTVNGHHLEANINVESIPLIKFISEINFDYTFLNLTHDSGIFRNTSNYLVHQFRSDLNYDIIFGLTQSWVFRYEDPINMSSRWLVDTYFNLPVWKLNSTFSIENLLDIQYEDESGFEAPGRWMKFGLQFQY